MSKRTIYSHDYEILLEMLRQARAKTGYTQAEIGKKIGVGTSALSKYERGELRLDLIQVRNYCNALGISFVKFTKDFDRKLGG